MSEPLAKKEMTMSKLIGSLVAAACFCGVAALLVGGCPAGGSGSGTTGQQGPEGPMGAMGLPGAPGVDGSLRIYGNGSAGAEVDRKSTRLNSSHVSESRMPSSAL